MSGGVGGVAERVWARRTPSARLASTLLAPASWPYAAVVALRNRLYDEARLHSERVAARVVSVGNLTVGGTGKTPTTLWLAERLAARGCRVAIVARGYRKRRAGVVIVGRDGRALVSARDGGDEAVLLARRFAGPVVVGEDRVAAARTACDECGAEVIVLDDGFQHRRLRRDFDVVLLAADPRRQRLLPAGPLREGPHALARAGAVVVVDDDPVWAADVVPAGRPLLLARTVPTAVVEVSGGEWRAQEPSVLGGRTVTALAGIARPERFVRQLERLGARVRAVERLDDHHVYDAADLARVTAWARDGLVVTTEKDLVKLVELADAPPVVALRVGIEVEPADELVRLAAGEDVVCGGTDQERR